MGLYSDKKIFYLAKVQIKNEIMKKNDEKSRKKIFLTIFLLSEKKIVLLQTISDDENRVP